MTTSSAFYRLTGALLIAAMLLLIGCFTLLTVTYDYPDVLRYGTGEVLTKYRAVPNLSLMWYGMTIGTFLLIPAALCLQVLLSRLAPQSVGLPFATAFGVLAGAFNVLGFIRWVFVVPMLAEKYAAATSDAARETIALVFEALHLYLGFSVGEHFGYVFLCLWICCLCAVLLSVRLVPATLSWLGIALGAGMLYGVTEAVSFPAAALVNLIASNGAMLWLLTLGVFLMRSQTIRLAAIRREGHPA